MTGCNKPLTLSKCISTHNVTFKGLHDNHDVECCFTQGAITVLMAVLRSLIIYNCNNKQLPLACKLTNTGT